MRLGRPKKYGLAAHTYPENQNVHLAYSGYALLPHPNNFIEQIRIPCENLLKIEPLQLEQYLLVLAQRE
jgi:hypothetical protein